MSQVQVEHNSRSAERGRSDTILSLLKGTPLRLPMAFSKHSAQSAKQIKRLALGQYRETVLAIAVFAGLVSAYMSFTHGGKAYLQLVMKSSVSSKAQVFYDIGRGLNEDDSQVLPLEAGETFQALKFPLPDQPIRLLRFDPLTEAGRVVLLGATFFRGDRSAGESMSLETLRPTNEIASMRFTPEGLVIETVPQAHDPQTNFVVQYPIQPAHTSTVTTVALGLFWFIGTALGCIAVLAWLSTSLGKKLMERCSAPMPALRFHQVAVGAFLLLILMFLRAPVLLTRPRFWAEEGTVWFQHGITHSAISNLFFVFPASGYYILCTNLAALLASATKSLAGLEYAPVATTYVAWLIQLVPFLIILCFKSHLFNSAWRIAVGCLILMSAPTATGELWLNSINSPSYLGAVAWLVLFVDSSKWTRRTTWIMRSLLLVAGLSGLYAAVLFPLYALSYFVYRERERIVQAGMLAGCFLMQVGVVFLVHMRSGLEPTRISNVTVDSALVNILFFEIVNPITGEGAARNVFRELGLLDALNMSTSVPRVGTVTSAAWLSIFVIALILMVLSARRLTSQSTLLIGGFVTYAAVTSIGSLNGIPNSRYAFLPGAILLMLLMDNIGAARRQFIAAAAGFVLAFALIRGIAMYRVQPFFSGPEWSREVSMWRANPDYALRVWPAWWTDRIHCKP